MRLLVLWLYLVLVIIPSIKIAPVVGAPQVAAPEPFPLTAEGHVGGDARIIKVVGQTGYLGEGNYFTILDLRTFPHIVAQSSLALESGVADIAVTGGMAYIALDNTKIVIAAIGNPQHPVLLGTFSIGSSGVIDDVEVVGTLLYVGSVQHGLQIFDVGNPAVPLFKGRYAVPIGGPAAGRDLVLLGSVAYAVSKSGGAPGVHVIDVSNPAAPSAIRVIPRSHSQATSNALTVGDGRLYVGESHGLWIYSLATPTNPNLLGSYTAQGIATMVVANQRVYTTSTDLGIIDVSTPSSPQWLGQQSLRGYALSAAVFGTTVLIAEGDRGLSTIGVSNPAEMLTIDHTYMGGETWDMDVAGNMAYVGTINGLQIVDIGDPTHPRIRSIFGKDVFGVKVSGGRAYLSILPRDYDFSGPVELHVVDVCDPDHPVLLGSIAPQSRPWRLEVVGTRIYLLGWDRLEIYDASDPSAIRHIASPLSVQEANDIKIAGDRVYVAGSRGLVGYDLDGTTVTAFDMNEECQATGMDVRGSLAYLTMGQCGLVIVDLEERSGELLRQVGRLPIPAQDVAVAGAVAIMADTFRDDILYAVDVSDPANPVVRDRASIPVLGWDIHIQGERVFVAGLRNGMQIFKAPLHYAYLPVARQN